MGPHLGLKLQALVTFLSDFTCICILPLVTRLAGKDFASPRLLEYGTDSPQWISAKSRILYYTSLLDLSRATTA